MTKEETLSYIKAYLDGDTVVGNIIPLRNVLESAIKYLSEPSLPSNLDEAAQKVEDYYDVGEEHGYLYCHRGDIKDAFKAGAEWMAGQGATCNGEIRMDFSDPDDIYARRLSADYWSELGPALMKVEPGDVLIQIRKKQ